MWSEKHYVLPPKMKGIPVCDACHTTLGCLKTGINCVKCILNEWRSLTAPRLRIRKRDIPILEALADWSGSDDPDLFLSNLRNLREEVNDIDYEEDLDVEAIVGEEMMAIPDSEDSDSGAETIIDTPKTDPVNSEQQKDTKNKTKVPTEGKSSEGTMGKDNQSSTATETESSSECDSELSEYEPPPELPPTPPRIKTLAKVLKKTRLQPPKTDKETNLSIKFK